MCLLLAIFINTFYLGIKLELKEKLDHWKAWFLAVKQQHEVHETYDQNISRIYFINKYIIYI